MATERKGVWPLLALVSLCGGCFTPQGLLFTRTTTPFSFPESPENRTATKRCTIDVTQLKEPLTRLNLSVIWTNRIVADAAERSGMREIRYADLETLALLNGVFLRRRVIFYGD